MKVYLDFLHKLLALGPDLPAHLADIQEIFSRIESIMTRLRGGPFAAARAAVHVSDEEEAAEGEIVAAMAGEGTARGIGDGTFLRTIWAFVNANPELMKLLLLLLTKKA